MTVHLNRITVPAHRFDAGERDAHLSAMGGSAPEPDSIATLQNSGEPHLPPLAWSCHNSANIVTMHAVPIMLGRLVTTALAALAPACSLQSDNGQRDRATRDSVKVDQSALVDVCAVARHPERVDGQRVRLRAIVVPDVEFADLTLPACMGRRWDGHVGIDGSREWDFSGIGAAIIEVSRRSTATRRLAAEGEFEGIVHARPRPTPLNAVGPVPRYFAMLQVEKVDHVRLVELGNYGELR